MSANSPVPAQDITDRIEIIHQFIDDVCNFLEITPPLIELIDGVDFGKTFLTFGVYSPNEKSIRVAIDGRHLMDVLRTIAHELVHHQQNLRGALSTTPIEDLESEANTVAAVIMRSLAKSYPMLFSFLAEEAAVNSAGSGEVAGIGVGVKGEPGIKPRKIKSYKMFKRGMV